MGNLTLITASLLGFAIIINEVTRKKHKPFLDILTLVNLVYFLCFVIVPISLYTFVNFEDLPSWARKNTIENKSFFLASLYSIIGYIALMFGFGFARILRGNYRTEWRNINYHKVLKATIIVTAIGLLSFALFVKELGGLLIFLQSGITIRNQEYVTYEFGFLTNLTIFSLFGSFMSYGILKDDKSKRINLTARLLFFINTAIAFLVLFQRAGRLSIVLFIATFLIVEMQQKNKIKLRYLLIILITFVLFTLYGKRLFHFFVLEDFTFENTVEDSWFKDIIIEFSFPFISLANALQFPFFGEKPRLFIDFPIAVFNLLPIGIDLKNVTMLNTESFAAAGIPVDIVTLGFYSFGVAGIILLLFFVGFFIFKFEYLFKDNQSYLSNIIYVRWMMFFALFIAYAGPTNLLKNNLNLFFTTILLLLIVRKSKVSKNN